MLSFKFVSFKCKDEFFWGSFVVMRAQDYLAPTLKDYLLKNQMVLSLPFFIWKIILLMSWWRSILVS